MTCQLGRQVSSCMRTHAHTRTHAGISAAACFSLLAVVGAASPATGVQLKRRAERRADEVRFLARSQETTGLLTYHHTSTQGSGSDSFLQGARGKLFHAQHAIARQERGTILLFFSFFFFTINNLSRNLLPSYLKQGVLMGQQDGDYFK